MTSDKIKLNRRKALAGMAGIGVASVGAGAGTLAYFSDDEVVSDNTIEAGTLGLSVTNGQTISYSFENAAPGDTAAYNPNTGNVDNFDFNVEIENTGTIAGEILAIYIENATSDASGNDMEEEVLVRDLKFSQAFIDSEGDPVSNPNYDLLVDGTDHTDELSGPVTLADISDVELRIVDSDGDPPLEIEVSREFYWSFKISEGMGNEFQGAELDTTYNFALLQDDSQSFSGGSVN